jgi:DNA processing protein
MADIATRVALSDDPRMPRARDPKSRYIPPRKSESIMLSEALRGTGRLPDNAQMNFLDDKEGHGDLRIYYAGDIALLKRPSVAIVGTREVSDAGTTRTKRLTRELVAAGINIVSGLAYGVDTVAHETAIESGGKTVAVIGTPLDKASPSDNARLQEHIYREHLLISRFEKGEKTFRTNFPLRNRLMAVLSDATVVMEASDTSGTLHQAAECKNLGRWLFIAKSVVNDPSLKWPKKFLKYERCIPLENVADITRRIFS